MELKITKYKLVKVFNDKNENLEELLRQGWTLYGNPFKGNEGLYQPVVLHEMVVVSNAK